MHDFDVRTFPATGRRSSVADRDLERLEADLVFQPSHHDVHQDHQTIAAEGLRAFKRTTILGYEIPWNDYNSCRPTSRSESEEMEKKVAALERYASQQHRRYANAEYVWNIGHTTGRTSTSSSPRSSKKSTARSCSARAQSEPGWRNPFKVLFAGASQGFHRLGRRDMKRLLPVLAVLAVLAAFAVPSVAAAHNSSGVVLKVDRSAHLVGVTQGPHRVSLVHTAAASHLRVGQRISLNARTLRNGTLAASQVRVVGRAHAVRFRGLVLALLTRKAGRVVRRRRDLGRAPRIAGRFRRPATAAAPR